MDLPTLYVAGSTSGSAGFAWCRVERDVVVAENQGTCGPTRDVKRIHLQGVIDALQANRGDLRVCTVDDAIRATLSTGLIPRRWATEVALIERVTSLVAGRVVTFETVRRNHPVSIRVRNAARRASHGKPPAPAPPAPAPLAPKPAAPSPAVVAYTDGGCRTNPGGVGGWGFLLVHVATGAALERRGAHPATTNNRMEMTAAIEALRALKGERVDVEIRTDSKYLRDMGTKWLVAWKYRGWRRVTGEVVLNLDLVQELDRLIQLHRVRFTWVAGHSGDPGNTHVDRLATLAMDDVERGRDGTADRRYPSSPVGVAPEPNRKKKKKRRRR